MYRDNKVLVIIPAYNEEESIVSTTDALKKYPEYDYIVIDDGSRDKTKYICKQNNIPYISLPVNLGIGGAVQTGYKYAYANNYDIAIQFDGDGQHDADYISTVVDEIIDGKCDFGIGTRFLNNDTSGFKSTRSRRMGITLLSWLIKVLTGKKITDPTSGFRAANKEIIEMFAEHYPIEYPEPETIVALLVKDFKIREVSVNMFERSGGVSSINAKKAVHYMVVVMLSMIMARVRR